MTRHYCDICGKEVDPDRIHGRSFSIKYKDVKIGCGLLSVDDRDWLMCDSCYEDLENYIIGQISDTDDKEGEHNET